MRQRDPLDRDRLGMVPRGQAADTAQLALFPIQDERPEVLVAGVAILYAALCARCGLDPEDMWRLGSRLLADQDFHTKTNNSLQSLRDFAGLRVMGQDVVIS